MNLKVGEYYFWGEGFGSYSQHHIDYLVRLCEVLYDSNEVVFKVLHQGFSNEYGLLRDSDARNVGELCKEDIPSERLEHLNYLKPVDLNGREFEDKEYEEIARIIRYDRLRFLRRQLTQIIEKNQLITGNTSESWLAIPAILTKLDELNFPTQIKDLLFLSEFNNRFDLSENKDKIRLKS